MSGSHEARLRFKLSVLLAIAIALVVLALAFRQGDWSISDIHGAILDLRGQAESLGLAWGLAGIVVASVAAIPLGLIIALVALLFGPWLGSLLTLCGATIGAAISYGLGSYLGHDALCRFAGERINGFSQKLARRGILTVIIIRLLPIAPFAIVNMVAGTTHVRMRDFILGTMIGMLPGLLLIGFSAVGLVEAISR